MSANDRRVAKRRRLIPDGFAHSASAPQISFSSSFHSHRTSAPSPVFKINTRIPFLSALAPPVKVVPTSDVCAKLFSPGGPRTSSTIMRPLTAPPILHPTDPVTLDKRMRTITLPPHVAFFPNIDAPPYHDAVSVNTRSEMTRGLSASPNKGKGNGKGRRYHRSGLAQVASDVLSRSNMAHSLWQAEVNPFAPSASSGTSISASGTRLDPDLTLTLLSLASFSPKSPSYALFHTRALYVKDPTALSIPTTNVFLTLFKLPQTRSAVDVVDVNSRVHVWPPWFWVELQDALEPAETKAAGIGHVLLCTRFLVVRS